MTKTFKTYAYDVQDIDTKEKFTVYWSRTAGVDYWNDFGIPVSTPGSVYPSKTPSYIYDLLSEMYEVEIEYTPRVEASMEVRKV